MSDAAESAGSDVDSGRFVSLAAALGVRKYALLTETIHAEQGQQVARPITRVAAVAVVANPFAGSFVPDLTPLEELSEALAEILAERAVAALPFAPESFGKAAIVGVNGELEHAAAILHPRLGGPLRAAIGDGRALVPSSKKVGAAGTAIDVPLHFKDAAYVRSHFDALEVRLADAPRPNEIVVIIALTDGGRPHPRVGGLTVAEALKKDGLR